MWRGPKLPDKRTRVTPQLGGGDDGGTVYTHRPSGFCYGCRASFDFFCDVDGDGDLGPGTGAAIACSQLLVGVRTSAGTQRTTCAE